MKILKDKIRELFDRLQLRSTDTQAHEMRQFLKETFMVDREPHELSKRDLLEIRCQAIDLATNLRHDVKVNGHRVVDDPDMLQAYCFFCASYAFLRGKSLMFHDVNVGDEKDRNERKLS